MLRGSWEPCQQMGPPGFLTKPTNPSQARSMCKARAPYSSLGSPEKQKGPRRNSLARASLVGGGRKVRKGQAWGWVCPHWPMGAEPAQTEKGCFGILL